MFSIRNLLLGIVVIFLVIGGFFSIYVGEKARDVFVQQTMDQRVQSMVTLSRAIFGSGGYFQNGRITNAESLSQALNASLPEDQLGERLGKNPFYIVINSKTKIVAASNDPQETGAQFTHVPKFSGEMGDVQISEEKPGVYDITIRGTDSYVLWMKISDSILLANSGALAGQLFVYILVLCAVLGVVMLLSVHFVVVSPLMRLVNAIENLGKGKFDDIKFPKSQQGRLNSAYRKFNVMVDSISSVRERDEFISSMKSDFITTAAHQLRTPLSAIKWSIKIILDQDFGPLNVDQKTILMKGYESNSRMIRLVNDLLDVDRIDSGRLQYEFAPVDIINLINSVLVVVTPRTVERNLSIVITDSERKYPKIKADTEKLRQVIQNLIDNAVKYSYPGGKVVITVEEAKGDMLSVSVSDTGIGIPKEQQEKIFGKFFRADNARKLQTDGSGLGLYIMNQIIKKHGGEVSFTSEEGKGTTFTFTVPLYKE